MHLNRITPRWRGCLAAGALCAMTLLAYGNSFQSGFPLDNRILLLQDSRVHQVTAANVSLIVSHTYFWPTLEAGLYRPVTTLSYLFNYAILGNAQNPAGYHWLNLLLHIGDVLLVLALAKRLTGDFRKSFLIAALWAVHPVLTESVTNIIGRADLLAGMATLAGLLIYLRSQEATGWRRLGWLAALTAVTSLGVFAKESAVAVVGVIALYELTWRKPGRWRGIALAGFAVAPVLLAMWWMRSRVLAASAQAIFPFVDNPIVGAGFFVGRLTAVKVMAKYLGLLVWPRTLSADYSYPQIPLAYGSPGDWVSWIVIAAIVAAVAFSWRRNKTVFFAAGFAFLTLLPASNLIVPVGAIMAERFLYLPAVGFAICLTLALYGLARRFGMSGWAPLAAGLIIVTAFAARTWARNPDWRDDLAFWSAAVRTSPRSFKAHLGLAQELMHAPLRDTDRILSEDEQSMALLDSLPDTLNSPAVYVWAASHYVAAGDEVRPPGPAEKPLATPESTAKYEHAHSLLLRAMSMLRTQQEADRRKRFGLLGDHTSINSDIDLSARLLLSETDQRLGEFPESLRLARDARHVDPASFAAYDRLHDILQAMGRREEAMAALMQGVLLTSNPALSRKLLAGYAETSDAKSCAISFAQAQPRVDFSCRVVRDLACSVAPETLTVAVQSGDRPAADRLRNRLKRYGCAVQ